MTTNNTNAATKTATITGAILKGNYLGAPMRSCKKVDYVTKQRVIVTIDGVDYDRAVYERAIWRNGRPNTVLARFVWISGKFYVLADEEETVEETTEETMTETDARAYATKTDVMEQEIIPALDGHEDDYDLDAIFDACWEWRDGAFVQNDADFWAVVQANDISEAC